MTLEEVIERIKQEAIHLGASPEQVKKLLDSELIVELILPKICQEVTKASVKDELKLNALRSDHSVDITAGAGPLPVDVEEDYAEHAYLTTQPMASYVRQPFDYFNNGHSVIPTFYIGDGNLYYRDGGASATAYTGRVTLNAVTTPTLPATLGTAWTVNASVLEDIIFMAANLVADRIPLSQFGMSVPVE